MILQKSLYIYIFYKWKNIEKIKTKEKKVHRRRVTSPGYCLFILLYVALLSILLLVFHANPTKRVHIFITMFYILPLFGEYIRQCYKIYKIVYINELSSRDDSRIK